MLCVSVHSAMSFTEPLMGFNVFGLSAEVNQEEFFKFYTSVSHMNA